MRTYHVDFEIAADDYRSKGEYVVAGRDFYLRTDDTEVYAESGIRREITRSKKEITIDTIDASARDIISNPSTGFSALSEDFSSTTVPLPDGGYRITFVPKAESSASETITVSVAKDGRTPTSIIYNTASGAIEVRLRVIEPAKNGCPHYDETKYRGYEVIDFR